MGKIKIMIAKILFSASLIAVADAASQDVCRAAVLSGGGNNGAWEVGVVWGLINYGVASDYAYDVISGVSAGSINAGAMAGWAVGDDVNMIQWVSDMWKNLKSSDVWKDWSFGKVEGITIKGGAVDNSPLLGFLQNALKDFTDF